MIPQNEQINKLLKRFSSNIDKVLDEHQKIYRMPWEKHTSSAKKSPTMKTSVYVAASLDGFIARENGDIDWLDESGEESGEDYGYKKFMDTIDCIVMGRITYEKALMFREWPYHATPVVVLSSHPLHIPERLIGCIETMSCSPNEVITRLTKRGAKHLYIDGGKTIQEFLAPGLINRLIITRIPVLIGKGIALFGPLSHDVKLRHIETRQFPNGFVQSEYEILSTMP
jgi:dihydrofolate reductase